MQHLEEGILHELLDGEIPSSDLPPIQAHLAACPECRVRLEEAREFAGEADRLIETIELTEEPPARPAIPLRPAPRRRGRDLAWAATVVLAVGAGYLARGGGRPAGLALQDSTVPAFAADSPAPALQAAPAPAPPAEAERSADAPADGRAGAGNRADDAARERIRTNAQAPSIVRRQDLSARTAAAKETKDLDSAPSKRKLGDQVFALEEIVTTSVADKAAPQATGAKTSAREPVRPAPATPPSAGASLGALKLEAAPAANELRLDETGKVAFAKKREGTPVETTLSEAMTRLSGRIRLIEGLVPLRLEAMDTVVRVVYPLSSGELALEQWLAEGRVTYRLVAPANFPVDSLERLRARVRD